MLLPCVDQTAPLLSAAADGRERCTFFAGQEEGDFARGDSLKKDDRSLAPQRFRQVARATDENFISRIALRRLRTQVVSDHFFGTIAAAASAVNSKRLSKSWSIAQT